MSSKAQNVAMALTAVVVLAVAVTIYLNFWLPKCSYSSSASSWSNQGRYGASVEWRRCEKESESRGQVLIASTNATDKIVALEFRPPDREVRVDWKDGELVVTVDKAATIKKYGPYKGWPRIRVVQE